MATVLLIEPSGVGGLIHYAYSLGTALSRRGHRVILATSYGHETGGLPREFEVREIFRRFATNPWRLLRMLTRLKRDGVDVVHVQGAIHPEMYLPFVWVLRRAFGWRVVYTAHEILPQKNRLTRHAIFRWAVDRAGVLRRLYALVDAIVVHAEHNRVLLLETFPVPAAKVHAVPLGSYLFLADLGSSDHTASRDQDGTATILFFGIIVESKGLLVLLRAMPAVLREVPQARLVIAGQPYEDPRKYLDEIRRLGLERRVVTDFRYIPLEEIPPLFRAADVVTLPYLDTYQSAVVQTAYAFGRPVVASACGGLPEVIEDGRSGRLVPPGDPSALASALVDVLRDAGRRAAMGGYARSLTQTRFSWDQIAAQTEALYALPPGAGARAATDGATGRVQGSRP